jgi:hypothetical protein
LNLGHGLKQRWANFCVEGLNEKLGSSKLYDTLTVLTKLMQTGFPTFDVNVDAMHTHAAKCSSVISTHNSDLFSLIRESVCLHLDMDAKINMFFPQSLKLLYLKSQTFHKDRYTSQN